MAKKTDMNKADNGFAIGRKNYIYLIIGFAVIVVGFLLMMGGKSDDPNVFNGDAIFSFRRITIAPLIVLAGFIFEIWAIMKKPAPNENE